MSQHVFIGLGSNLQGPVGQVRNALEGLAGLPSSRLLRTSRLYRNPPMGPQDQPEFINAVARIETLLSPLELLDALQGLEQRQGRERGEHWGPRTLDLDLLLFGARVMDGERLTVPHPGLAQRAFVLVPLAELAPTLMVPGLGRVSELLTACARKSPGGCQGMVAVAGGGGADVVLE